MKFFEDKIKPKIKNWSAAAEVVNQWKNDGQKVVFTNGCFDLIHLGHIQYLAQARSLGDKLVIGLNSSASVKRLKGQHRPINDQMTRETVLAALEMVDLVVVFEEDTPYQLIEALRPSLLVKGGDWQIEQIVGADIVLANGGAVKSLAFVEGYSTTKLEEKIKANS